MQNRIYRWFGVLPRDLLSTDVSKGTLATQQLRARANATIFVTLRRVVHLATFLSGKGFPFGRVRCPTMSDTQHSRSDNHIAGTVFPFGTVGACSWQTRHEARRVAP
ncbi:hypothetical protein BQ8794_180060 [Mesorhizobium prunaredense]|uniref:Uncharacterized protein n=1 Tax=Mesorhizobium prunaredense TaxID=1631249 RepID=A0A1R3V7E4_9HYPH|nr:hypothetical protein BQ8794_180060 [Mesorhizobium prunaredense]